MVFKMQKHKKVKKKFLCNPLYGMIFPKKSFSVSKKSPLIWEMRGLRAF
jgi:hypothetical protein